MRSYHLIAATLLVACGGGEEAPEALRDVDPPPVNAPLTRAQRPEGEQGRPTLPADSAPALVLSRGERAFAGTLRLQGALRAEAGSITIAPQEGEALRIDYRLPRGVPQPAYLPARASAEIRELGGPEGADRRVVVGDPGGLTLAEVWQSSPDPVSVELTGGVSLTQGETAGDSVGYTAAPLRVVQGGQTLTRVPIGEPIRVSTGQGALVVYALVSHRHIVPEGEDAAGDRYILHAWVSGQGRGEGPAGGR